MAHIKLTSAEQDYIYDKIKQQIDDQSFHVDDRIIQEGDRWHVNIVIGMFDDSFSGIATLMLPEGWHIPTERIKE